MASTNEFSPSLKIESQASPLLDRWYEANFKNLVAILDVTTEKVFQYAGIDKFLLFQAPNLPKLVYFTIDEKARSHSWNDIIAEIWSKREKEIPGWTWTSKADYIVYAFIENNSLAEPPRFIPTLDFAAAIKNKDFPMNEARNLGWTTIFKIIPKEELPSKPPQSVSLPDFC